MEVIAQRKNVPKLQKVDIRTSTWKKISHGLYDYQAEQDQYRKESLTSDANCDIYRSEDAPKTLAKTIPHTRKLPEKFIHVASVTTEREGSNARVMLKPIASQSGK